MSTHTDIKSRVDIVVVVMLLAALTGGSLTLAIAFYGKSNAAEERVRDFTLGYKTYAASYSAAVELQSFDPESQSMTATIIRPSIGDQRNIRFNPLPQPMLSIEGADPVYEGDTLVGFSNFRKSRLEDLAPGTRLLVRLLILPDGSINALDIVETPLPILTVER